MFNVTHASAGGRYDAIGLELVTTTTPESDDPTVVYFEYLATPVVARAVNAYLHMREHKETSSLMWNHNLPVRLSPAGRYSSMLRRIDPFGYDNVAIAHQGLASTGVVPETYFLTKDGAEPPDFRQRLKQALAIGLKDEWPAILWDKLTHLPKISNYSQVLTKLPSQGDLEVWELAGRETKLWQRILTDYCLEARRD